MSPLSKKEDWTELDEQFKNLMQKMMEDCSDICDESRKGVDYSFLDNNPKFEGNQFNVENVNVHKSKRGRIISRFASRVAVIAIGILVAGSGIAVWINSQQANALKFEAEKNFYEVKDGVFSTEQNSVADETCITRKFKSMDDIDKAKEVMPNLPVPEYIPEVYKFESLKISKDIKNKFSVEYAYNYDKNNIFISIINIDEETKLENIASGEIIEQNGQKFCIWEDKSVNKYGCTFIKDDLAIFALGDASKEEMLKVAVGLN